VHFANIEVLWWLAALPALSAGAWLVSALRRRRLVRFAGGATHAGRFGTQVSAHRRALRHLLLLLALAGGVIAWARPQWGARIEPLRTEGIDVAVVLDTSLSMAAEDVAPSRLGQARRQIDTLVGALAGNRIGLVSFAGDAVVNCPLTPDHEAVRLFLDTLDVETAPVPGTSLASALRLALTVVGDEPGSDGRGRAIVVFSDGEDHGRGVDEAIAALRTARVKAFAVGCGTTRGAPIPLKDAAGMITGYKKDPQGELVTTRLEETALRKLAVDTGGRYFQATPTEGEIDEIAASLLEMQTGEFGTTIRPSYEERFQLPLGLALLALLGHTLLADRRGGAS